MFSLNDKISIRQLQVLIILDIFGTGVIILPRKAATFAGGDGWISVGLSAVLAMLCVFIITRLIRLFPGKSFFEYTSLLVSKPVAFLLTVGLILKTALSLVCELRFFGEIVKNILLYHTPFALICGGLLLVSAYAAGKGIETRARIGQIIIWPIFLPLIFVFALVSIDVDFTTLLPVMKASPGEIGQGAFHCLFAFSGIEFLLLMSPYLCKYKGVTPRAVAAVAITGIFLLAVTVITICRFGSVNIQNQVWPVLEMMDAVDLPGTFVERQEALIMSFWILSVFATVNAGLFFTAVAARSAVKKGKHSYYLFTVAAAVFLSSLFLKDINVVYKLIDLNFLYAGTMYMLVIPAALLIIAKFRGYAYE